MTISYMLTAKDFIADAIERLRKSRPDCFGGVVELPVRVFREFADDCGDIEIQFGNSKIFQIPPPGASCMFMNVRILCVDSGVPRFRSNDGDIEEL